MTLVAVVGGKGSPGVTTTALALAAIWPRPVVLAECDPSGGDVPYLLPAGSGSALTATRGVVSLAVASRSHSRAGVGDHLQVVAGGLQVLVGAATRAQMTTLAPAWPDVVSALTTVDTDVVADCGRFLGEDTTTRLLDAASLTVVVCRPTPVSVAHARDVLTVLGHAGEGATPAATRVIVVMVGDRRELPEVRRVFAPHAPVLTVAIADDPRAAAGLCGHWSRSLDRSRLVVDARAVARQIDRVLTSPHSTGSGDLAAVDVAVDRDLRMEVDA